MTLPSNSSMNVFPDNTLTTYKTLLPEYVSASTPLECALQEITCPTSWYNVIQENILLIQGGAAGTSSSTPHVNTKLLHQALTKSTHPFFAKAESGEPILSRTASSPIQTILKDCLDKGVVITRSQNANVITQPDIPDGSKVVSEVNPEATGTPSGGTVTNQPEPPKAAEEKEAESAGPKVEPPPTAEQPTPQPPAQPPSAENKEAEVERFTLGNSDIIYRESRAISPAVAAVRQFYSKKYTEVATVMGSSGVQLTQEEMTALNFTLRLKALDKLVSTFKFPANRTYRVFSLPGAFLVNNSDLIHFLNKSFNKKNPAIVKALRTHLKNNKSYVFTYNRYTMKCIVALPPDVILQLPVNLALQLGFGPGVFLTGKTESKHVVDVMFRAQTVYVYSDIVKHSIVGDKRAPLLRVVNVNPLGGDTQTVTFQPLIYQPVSKSSFRQISIYLRDRTGQPIPFERGAVTVVLAFRPASSL